MPARLKKDCAFRDLAEQMVLNLQGSHLGWYTAAVRQHAAASQTQSLIGASRNTVCPRLSQASIQV